MMIACQRTTTLLMALILFLVPVASCSRGPGDDATTGSVIFIHPDGSGTGAWTALRMLDHGPDGMLNWDRMSALGLYRGHQRNSLVSSSNAGATAHAFGTKAEFEAYGNDTDRTLHSASGTTVSIMREALDAGLAAGLVNSGQICEPGTGVFVADAPDRHQTDLIARRIIESGAAVILSGGEIYLLPEGTMGRHGRTGVRTDGIDVIERARELGYAVVYTRDELMNLPEDTERVLGVFAAKHTFNDRPEEELAADDLPLYDSQAPTVAEMTDVALTILSRSGTRFLLVVEEEGSDNFANRNNAVGAIEALRRADAAIGTAMRFIDEHPATLLITAADSDAGGMKVVRVDPDDAGAPLPTTIDNGAPLDGRAGTASLPFLAAPDRAGERWPFAVTWAAGADLGGGVIARAHGLNSEHLPSSVDNTDVYRLMYRTLFGGEADRSGD
jgi:alkaline phosphatase